MSEQDPSGMREVLDLLAEETTQLRRLHRLSRLQRRYMVRQDARRVRWTAEQIEQDLPRVRELAQRRILAVEAALAGRGRSLKELMQWADTPWRGAVTAAVRALAEAGDQLHRANFQNYQLASFSLDLTQEEMRLLVGSHEEGDAYAPDGQRSAGELNAVLDGRA